MYSRILDYNMIFKPSKKIPYTDMIVVDSSFLYLHIK